MKREGRASFGAIFLLFIVIALAVLALIWAFQMIFGGQQSAPTSNTGEKALVDTSENRAVRMTLRGPIQADENARSYQITVSPSRRNMTLYRGYVGTVDKTTSDYNNIQAYAQFVYALDKAGMMSADELTGDDNDTRGVCASGRLYEFEVLADSKTVKKLWTTSCNSDEGSLKVSASNLNNLFLKQIIMPKDFLNGSGL